MTKEQFLKLKEDLKAEAQKQRNYKQLRKTSYEGERSMDAGTAQYTVQQKKKYLDKMYVVYYILKHRIEIDNLKDVIADVYSKTHKGCSIIREDSIGYNGKPCHVYYYEKNGINLGYYDTAIFLDEVMNLYNKTIKKYESEKLG